MQIATPLRQALLYTTVGLIISTLWMRASEGKWPAWRIQGSVAASLLLTAVVSQWIIAQQLK